MRQRVLGHLQQGDVFAITVPVLTEFLFGIGTLPRAAQNLREWQNLRNQFRFYGLDFVDAVEAAELRLALRRQGWQLKLYDALIAVIALRNDLILLTTDGDFEEIPNLRHENWLAT